MDIAALGIAMDTAGLKRGEDALNRAQQSANRTADAMDKVGASGDKASASIGGTGAAATSASTSLDKFDQSARQAQRSVSDLDRQSRSFGDAFKDFAIGATAVSAVTASVHGLVSALLEIPRATLDGIRGLAELQAQVDKTNIGLAFAAGGNAAAGSRDLDFLRVQVSRLGLDLGTASNAFVKLSAAARETTLEGRGARDIFLAISEAATVMHLSSAEAEGAFLAISQMISKGTVQAEELRGQLGERLPGAFQTAARALGVTTAELGKMLEQGQVLSSDFLPKFAAQLRKELAGSVEEAANSTQASIGRMDTAWTDFKRTVTDSGLGKEAKGQLDVLTDGINGVTEAIRQAKQEGSGFWGQFGAGLSAAGGFLNPLNAFSYRARSLQGMQQQRDQLTQQLKDPSLDKFDRAQRAYDLQQLNDRILAAQRAAQSPGGQSQIRNVDDDISRNAERVRAEAEARTRKFLSDGKNLTKSENRDKDLKEIDDEFKAATSGIEKGSSLYDKALAVATARKQEVWDKFNKAGITAGASARQNELGGEIAQLEGYARQAKAIERSSQLDLDQQRTQGLISEREYLRKSADLREDSLTDQLAIAELEAQAASGKKSLAERERYAAKVQELEEQIVNVRKEGANAVAAYDKRSADSLKAYTDALDNAMKLRQQEISQNIAGLGMGDTARDQLARIQQANRDFDQKFYDLSRSRREGRIGEDEYQAQLEALRKYQTDRVALEYSATQQMLDAQSSWETGAIRAVANYGDSARNVFSQTENLFNRAFSSMEDAVVNFAMTGKLNFSDFARSVISDLIRIQARSAVSGIFSVLGGSGGLLGAAGDATGTSIGGVYGPQTQAGLDNLINTLGTRAAGGDVQAGKAYLVGESGRPEKFVPEVDGRILPDTALKPAAQAASAPTIEFHNTWNIDSRTDRQDIIAMVQASQQQTKSQILDSINRGGQFSQRR
ncbi:MULTISPECIES: phage tail tape measure protein [unclassified Cupriavidus]|uniref:phage tail tape measure protein n=1 Tax=unclassified Cupriavidus TaxID=2640874 RepID=UPI00313B1EF3